MVTVLNTTSGVLQLTIDPSMIVIGLGVTENTVVVMGDNQKAITWNLPARDCLPDARVGLEDCSRAMEFDYASYPPMDDATISPDSRHIAFAEGGRKKLTVCSASTGELLGDASLSKREPRITLWFSPDGCELWGVRDGCEAYLMWEWDGQGYSGGACLSGGWDGPKYSPEGWRTVDVEGYPWRSSRGYQVTKDRWILGPDGKRLLMLPPHFWSHPVYRVWKGRFLALLHSGLSEAVILELDP